MRFLALHLEDEILTYVLAIKEKKELRIKEMQQISLTKDDALNVIAALVSQKNLLIGDVLETSEVLLRSLELPMRSKKALIKALPFQLESLIPHSLDDMMIIPIFHSGKPGTVNVVCCHKTTYKEHLLQLDRLNIQSDWVGCIPQVLCRFMSYYTKEKEAIIIHMAEKATHIIAVLDNRPSYAFQIEIGKSNFFLSLKDDLSIKDEELEQLFLHPGNIQEDHAPRYTQVKQKFLKELDRVFYFLLHKKEGRRLDKLLLLKEEQFLIQFKSSMEASLDFPLQLIEIAHHQMQELKRSAICIGLAIDALFQDESSVQFYNHEQITLNMRRFFLKKIGSYAASYIGCCLILGLCSYIFLNHVENTLRDKLSSVLSRYDSEQGDDKKVYQQADLAIQIKQAEKRLGKLNKNCGYYLAPVAVGSFLNYLLAHEAFNKGLQLEKFSYELEQYPALNQPSAAYKIKAQVAVTCENQDQTREFFQQLFADKEWIEEPCQLNQNEKAYEATFYIRNTP